MKGTLVARKRMPAYGHEAITAHQPSPSFARRMAVQCSCCRSADLDLMVARPFIFVNERLRHRELSLTPDANSGQARLLSTAAWRGENYVDILIRVPDHLRKM